MANSLEETSWIDRYEEIRRQAANDSNKNLLIKQDIDMGLTPAPAPTPVIQNPSMDSTQAILNEQGKPSEAYMASEGGVGKTIMDSLSYITSPFAAFGDAALAPLGQDIDTGSFLGDLSENFKVSGKSFMDALLPEYGAARPEYGKDAAKQLGINENWALPLEILSDPTMVMGLGSAKMLQKSIRGQGLVAPGKEMGMWEGVAHETLGFGAPDKMTGGKLTTGEQKANTARAEGSIKDAKIKTQIAELNTPAFDELVKRADAGDATATKQVIDALDTDPRVAKYAASVEDSDIAKVVNMYDKKLGNPNKYGIIKDKDIVITSEMRDASVDTNMNIINGKINMSRGPAVIEDIGKQADATWELLKSEGKVNDIGVAQKDQLVELTQRKLPDANMSEKDAYRQKQTIIASGESLHEMARRANRADADKLDQLNFDRAYALHKLVEANDANAVRSYAATLNGLMAKSKDARGRLKQMNKLMDPLQETNVTSGTRHTRELQIRQLSDPTMGKNKYAVSRYMSKIPKGKVSDVFFELYTNSILSGPMTHAVNLASNGFLTMWSPTQSFLEGTSAMARGDFDKGVTNMAESIAKVAGIGQGFADAYRIMVRKTPLEELGYPEQINKRHELAHQMINPSITAEALNQSGTLGRFIDAAGKVARLPGNALMAEDKWMKIMHHRIELNAAAVRDARGASSDLSVQRSVYNQRRMNPSEYAITKSSEMADYYTFTNELDGRFAAIAKGIRAVPGARYFVPFFNTPTNIVKMGLRNSVIGNLRYDFKNALAKGSKGDVARAKIAMGTGAAVAVLGILPEGDTISGRVDMSTPKGKFKAEMGIPAYSIRIGDEWYSYERMEPMRSILGMFVNYKEAYNAIEDVDPKTGQPTNQAEELATFLLAPLVNTLGDAYMIDSIGGMLSMLEGVASGNPDYAYSQLQKTVTSMIPYSSATKQITRNNPWADETSKTYRKADGWIEKAMMNIPTLSKHLPAGKTIWGDDQIYPDSFGPDLISPVYTASVSTDAYDQEIIRLDIPIPGVPKEFSIEGVTLELSPQQRETFGILRGKGFGEGMPTLKETIIMIMDDPSFIQLSDIDKRAVLSDRFNSASQDTRMYMFGTDYDLQTQFDRKQENLQIEKQRTRQ